MTDRVPPAATPDTERRDREQRWAERWAEQRGPLVRYVRHLSDGDVHAAEDVVQETAIRLWQHPEVVDGEPLAGWLRTVARNIVVDRARRRRARPAEVELTPGIDVPGAGTGGTELDAVLTAAVSTLSSGHRAAIWEVYVRDRPVVDVAVELDIPAGTVKSRCHTARRLLRTAIRADCA